MSESQLTKDDAKARIIALIGRSGRYVGTFCVAMSWVSRSRNEVQITDAYKQSGELVIEFLRDSED